MNFLIVLAITSVLSACSSLLPAGRQETITPWHSFEEAKAAYETIETYRTTREDLHALGYDPGKTANVTILNQSQVVKTVVPQPSLSIEEQPQGIRDCIRGEDKCIGYALEQSRLNRKRIGNFFLDFMNFDRETSITGWRFSALIVIVDGIVVYKQWSGQPLIHQFERNRNPLGPLQGAGDSRSLIKF